MLNDAEIKDLCITRHMITPFDESQLQPCSYDITLEIKNLNNHPIRIVPGMKIGQLCFFDLHNDVNRAYGSNGLGSHYQHQSGPTTSR